MNYIRVGHMTYLNSAVFYHRLPRESCNLVPLPPRAMADEMKKGNIDAGPIPMAEVLRNTAYFNPLGSLCVAVKERAVSVLLFSKLPATELGGARIGVTSHTATSIQLLRVLFRDLWKSEPAEYTSLDETHDAALRIGDPALEFRAKFKDVPFVYDLASEWKGLTGLPFVFARWVMRQGVDKSRICEFEKVLTTVTKENLANVNDVVANNPRDYMDKKSVRNYISEFTYFLGKSEEDAIYEFKSRMESLPPLI